MTSVMVACPSNRGGPGPAASSLWATVVELQRMGFTVVNDEPRLLLGCSSIDLARNTLLRDFLDSGADIFMSFDDDESWPANDAVVMAQAVVTDNDFVSGVYAKKWIDTARLRQAIGGQLSGIDYQTCDAVELSEAISGEAALALMEGDTSGFAFKGHRFVRCRWVGAGALCLSRRGIERMVKAYTRLRATVMSPTGIREIPTLFLPAVHNGQYLTEDVAYCQRWTNIGGLIYAMTTSRFVHYGSFPYRIALDKRLEER
jgi:hypothetical protein